MQCMLCSKYNPNCGTCNSDGTCAVCNYGYYVKNGKVRAADEE